MHIPCRNTNTPITIGSPIFPVLLANCCAPRPNAQATNVANPLFNPFPIVAPKKKKKREQQFVDTND